MKFAQLADGQPVEAAPDAPSKAKCPQCGGVVVLRHRRLMNGRDVSYFWRHLDNKNRRCPARLSPTAY
jgi:hypothetical protein